MTALGWLLSLVVSWGVIAAPAPYQPPAVVYSAMSDSIDVRGPIPQFDDSLGVRITAAAAYVEDWESKAPLWESSSTETRVIASLTKLMTVLLVVERKTDLDELVTIEESDYTTLGYRNLNVGDTLSVHDLIAATLITSDNTAANALARVTSGDRGTFVALMNERAATLGLRQTRFADPSGLSNDNVSTAREIVSLARETFRSELLRTLSQQRSYVITKNGSTEITISNTNQLLGGMISIIAGKTGFVSEAGYNFLAISERDRHMIIGVVLGSASNVDRFQDYKMLAHWIWEHFLWPV